MPYSTRRFYAQSTVVNSRLAIGTCVCLLSGCNHIHFRISQIERRIQVSVYDGSAVRTFEYSVRQFQICFQISAAMACFARRIPCIYNSQFDAVCIAFRTELRSEFVELLVCYCFRKMPVPHHAFHIQILNGDIGRLGFRDVTDTLIQIICPDVIQPLMKSLYLQLLLFYI